jgi:hypothetical protein
MTGSHTIALLLSLGFTTACGSAAALQNSGTAASGAPATPATTIPATSAATSPRAGVKRADLLNGVSCAGRQCTAVGSYYYGGAASHTLVEFWTGSAWSVELSPDGPTYSSLRAVSCDVTAGCLAVGSPVLAGNGNRWRIVSPVSSLDAVSCTDTGSCIAVGANTSTPVYASWTGRAWHTGTMHAPPQQAQGVTVAGVSCASASNCTAVGDYFYGATAQPSSSYRDKILAEQWNGSSWRLLPTINVGRVDQLTAVSCISPDNCTAVGTSAQQYPLAESWNGTTWRVEPVPAPGTIGYTQLTSVSCTSAGSCVAVGTYQGQPIAESWNGTAWRLQQLPEPPVDNYSAQLNGVSCASPSACMAVGVSGSALSYAERYNGLNWRLTTTQNPT